jgi:hypothetical protein
MDALGRSSQPPAAGSSTVEADRNRLIANNEVRSHPLHRTAWSGFRKSAEELCVKRADLHFCESCPETKVLTGSEPDVRRLCARDIKAIWIGENRFITIPRAIPENYLVTRTD